MGFLGMSDKNAQIVKAFILMVIVLSTMVFIPQVLGLGKGGFSVQEILTQFFFYVASAGIFGIIILVLILVERAIQKDDSKYGEGLGFYSPGETPHFKTPWFNNPIRLAFASLIVFTIIGLYAGVNQHSFTGVGKFQQTFTKFDNTVYNGSLVAASENLGAAALIALIIFGARMYARKKSWSRGTFLTVTWVSVPLVVGVYGVLNHLLRYGNTDTALNTVFGFWAFGGFITMLTGSFIPFWIAHITNNVFFDLGRQFANDSFVLDVKIAIGLMIAVFVWLYFVRKKVKSKESV